MSMQPSSNCISLLKEFEGFRSRPYADINGVPTIGYGSTYYPGDKHVTLADAPISQVEALALLLDRLVNEYTPQLLGLVKVPLNQNQFDALLDFLYNLGAGHLESSTLLRLLNAGMYTQAADEFDKWTSHGVPGLVRRRAAEKALFLQAVG